jgi:hypothetical protein
LYFSKVSISEKVRQLERLGEADELKFRGSREGFGDVLAVKGSAEAHVGRALSGHERMFALSSEKAKP